MIRLGVNVDHVATLRQARGVAYPDPVEAARMALLAGADSIVIHLREDRRHIQDDDVRRMRREIAEPLNLEMAQAPDVIAVALEVVPDQATLVPERRQELTTEGGLDVAGHAAAMADTVARLRDGGIACVSLFIEPDRRQIDAAVTAQADAIEIHTGTYANAPDAAAVAHGLDAIREATEHAAAAGLKVFAGHGLHCDNVAPIVAIPPIEELNIGHSLVARAVFTGLPAAVAELKDRMNRKERT